MSADHLIGIEKFEAHLWKMADGLRANSNLASNEYFLPILGLIFLRHATSRYREALEGIQVDRKAGKTPSRALVPADFQRRRALMLPEAAHFDALLRKRENGTLGDAITAAMEAVEAAFPPLAGQLPKDYQRFEDDVLVRMLRLFDEEGLRNASGDVFGRIYEYFPPNSPSRARMTAANSSPRPPSYRPSSTSSGRITASSSITPAARAACSCRPATSSSMKGRTR